MKTTIDLLLENYVLVEELSQDDMVTVYQGQRKTDQSPVMIKVVSPLLASDEFLVRRFKLTTQQTAKLEHPNIVCTYAAEQTGDLLYRVEDFVRAPTLAQVLHSEGSFSPQRMQFIVRQIASALDYAHQKSVTHGNLSAKRIFLGPDDRVWLADFGLTQALFGLSLPKQSDAMSDPETMAPERVRGQGPSRQSDLYALGILSYQMLAGKPPFSGSPSAVLHDQAYRQPQPLYRLNPGIPLAVSEVIGRMLSKGLELRYNTGAEFARALAVACTLSKNVPTHNFQQPGQRSGLAPRWLGSVLSGLLMVMLLAAGLVWAGYQWGLSQPFNSGQVASLPLNPPSPTSPRQTSPTLIPTEAANDSLSLVVTPTPTLSGMSLSDTLPTPTLTPIGHREPTPTAAPVSITITPTPLPAPALPKPAAVAQPAALVEAGPVIPSGKGRLVFYNPTGYDLVVDLTGPSSDSKLIPPNTRQEFTLSPGGYQCILHTLTGQSLATRVLNFDVIEGQVVEKDYYTEYDSQ